MYDLWIDACKETLPIILKMYFIAFPSIRRLQKHFFCDFKLLHIINIKI